MMTHPLLDCLLTVFTRVSFLLSDPNLWRYGVQHQRTLSFNIGPRNRLLAGLDLGLDDVLDVLQYLGVLAQGMRL